MESFPAAVLRHLQVLFISLVLLSTVNVGNSVWSWPGLHPHQQLDSLKHGGARADNRASVFSMAEVVISSHTPLRVSSSSSTLLGSLRLRQRRKIMQDGPKIMLGALVEEAELQSEGLVVAMQLAVEHLNQNASSLFGGAELQLRKLRPGRDQYEVAIATLDFLQGSEVAIIGPTFSFSARIMSTFAAAANVPTISPSASDPALSDKGYPFFLRTMYSDDLQMQAAANLVNFFNWTEVVAVHVNDDYGLGGIQALDAHLTNTRSRIVTRVPIQFEATKSEILQVLQQVRNRTETTAFVVHIQTSQVQRFFEAVVEAQMVGPGFVWVGTEAIVQLLLQLVENGNDITLRLEGLIGTQVVAPKGPDLDKFTEEWTTRNLSGSKPDLYTLRSYDAVQLVGRAIAEGLATGQLSQEDLTGNSDEPRLATPWYEVHQDSSLLAAGLQQNSLTSLGVRVVGEKIRNLTLALGMRGTVPAISGSVRLDENGDNVNVEFEVVNIVAGEMKTVGSWSMADGLILSSGYQAEKGGEYPMVTWPGRAVALPTGWLPNSGRVLRVAVPIETWSPYMIYRADVAGNAAFTGQIIETFESALAVLPYELAYKYEPWVGSYNDLCEAVDSGVYDLAVGDISITEYRSKLVDFTQQFQSAGLVVVAPLSSRHNLAWAFLEPFTWDMWAVLLGLFLFVALAIWWLERGTDGELSIRVKSRKAFGRAIWWSYTSLFFAHAAIVRTPLGRIVGGMWLFVVLIVVATYQANLTSTLTVQQLLPTIQGIASIIQSSSIIVGVSNGSWYQEALLTLGVSEARIVTLAADFEDYKVKLRGGYGGVDAVVDELPYALLFTGKFCEYGIVGQEFYKGGWGWAFPRGSRLQQEMSTAILQLSKDGTLYKLQQKWLLTKNVCGDRLGTTVEVNRLGLQALGPLFLILMSIATISCIVIFSIRFADAWWVRRQRPPHDIARMSSRASTRASTDPEPDTERGDEEEGVEEDKEETDKPKPSMQNLPRESTMGSRRGRSWHPRHLWLSRALDHQDSSRL